jgi:hypothetical protein
MKYYGLDIHKKFVQVFFLSPDGKERRDFQIQTTPEYLSAFGNSLSELDSVVMEVTFATWPIYSILKRFKAKVVVADSMRIKAIAWGFQTRQIELWRISVCHDTAALQGACQARRS